ncbi:apolipoprotein N-acyltransferase [Trichormus variabilis ARAD]|nr:MULTISPECIES: apolipoprotein N-acyltransferase [Nostocaceae]MBC1213191.1 apolipoprotein N-acyltransferase [Trichormus variabilis ARAD]MBC1253954.1 apolipoprotein N-acyltransferase [Trichormus variabilis V5]MBC1266665.1 apolipoprotein N-acyltransferase [Trichormus variabilis FSR]MBC1300738.1 apolipoprotein N-acyltransferase [Trichormus variabilis N2B]MBC1309695.1 apolipoprotein N-acyltransferase [Trichormus variabilis PNB]
MRKKLNKQQGEKLISLLPPLITLTSGIFMGLTVAPFAAWFLAWIALAPLWILLVSSKSKNHPPSSLLLLGLTWGIGYHGVALFWITGIHPMDWLGVPWWPSLAITIFCWLFISFYGGLFAAIWAACLTRFSEQKSWLRILIGTAIWCVLESLWSAGPLWWSSLAYTQSPHNLVILHLGQISGPNLVTAAIVSVNGLIAEAWLSRKQGLLGRYLAIAAGLLITLHLIGFCLYSAPIAQSPDAALKVGIVQGNIPNKIKLLPQGLRRAITGYTDGYLTLVNQGVEAVLTPEGALPFFQRNLPTTPLVAAVREKGVVAWIGAFGDRGRSYTNSLFTVNSQGEITSRYDKSKLVPLGEYIPFEGFIGGLVQRLSPLDEHQVHGSPNQIFDTPFGRAIVGICYESAFPEVFRSQAATGGQFILSSSNDAHYSAAMPFQHHAQDIMRAIETDRWSARATNTGYSAFVDPHGRTLWISGYNTYETHAETIYRRQTQTLYVRWGDWFTPLLVGLSFLGWGLNIFWRNDANTKYKPI